MLGAGVRFRPIAYIMRCVGMATFHLLYFRDSVLDQAEEVEARDVLEAVQQTFGRPSYLRVEIWSEHRKVAAIGRSSIEPKWLKARTPESPPRNS